MFTGLVECTGRVVGLTPEGGCQAVTVSCPFAAELAIGQSVAVDGACLTVSALADGAFRVLMTAETVSRGGSSLQVGKRVNLERALKLGVRLDGHLVLGHVDGTARVVSLRRSGSSALLTVLIPNELRRYVAVKGSVALDGVSLTVASFEGGAASVAVIPQTLDDTTLGERRSGDLINLEVDVIARYLERLVSNDTGGENLTMAKLAEMGW